jgi:hypothetical protein
MSSTASRRIGFFFLSIGHAYDHLFVLLFPTVVLGLEDEFDRPYCELPTLSFPGYSVCRRPAAGLMQSISWQAEFWLPSRSRPGEVALTEA